MNPGHWARVTLTATSAVISAGATYRLTVISGLIAFAAAFAVFCFLILDLVSIPSMPKDRRHLLGLMVCYVASIPVGGYLGFVTKDFDFRHRRLAEYDEIVRSVEALGAVPSADGEIAVPAEFFPWSGSVDAFRDADRGLIVRIHWGHSWPGRASGYVYASTGRIDDWYFRLRWERRLTANWFEVGF